MANLPGPEGDHESPPREEEYSTILVDHIEDGNRSGFVVGGIDLGRLPQMFRFKAHGDVAVTRSSVDKTEDRDMQKRQEVAAQDMSGGASSASATLPIFRGNGEPV